MTGDKERRLTKLELSILDAVRKGKGSRGDISKHCMKVAASAVQYSDKAGRGLGAQFGVVIGGLVKEGYLGHKGGLFSEKYWLTDGGNVLVEENKGELDKLSETS